MRLIFPTYSNAALKGICNRVASGLLPKDKTYVILNPYDGAANGPPRLVAQTVKVAEHVGKLGYLTVKSWKSNGSDWRWKTDDDIKRDCVAWDKLGVNHLFVDDWDTEFKIPAFMSDFRLMLNPGYPVDKKPKFKGTAGSYRLMTREGDVEKSVLKDKSNSLEASGFSAILTNCKNPVADLRRLQEIVGVKPFYFGAYPEPDRWQQGKSCYTDIPSDDYLKTLASLIN
jgi:hypothetical protein